MAEVCVERAVEWEGGRIGVKCRVGGRAVVNWRVGQAGKQFVDVTDALSWAKRTLAPSTLDVSAPYLDRRFTVGPRSPSLVVFVDVTVVLEVGEDVQ